jgi:CheY-like chemotaxis protein
MMICLAAGQPPPRPAEPTPPHSQPRPIPFTTQRPQVTACASCAEAVVQISSGGAAFDVLLADKAAIGATPASAGAPARSGLLDACRGLPVILMAADPSPADVMQGVSLGAVDFLAKPLSQLKLRNIWQHTVRKMMADVKICAGNKLQPLDRSASNAAELAAPAADEKREAAAAAAAPAAAFKAPAGLPPRSPGVARRGSPLRARRAGRPLHACISSTNLAAPAALPEDADAEDADFDFEAAAAAAAPVAPSEPCAYPSSAATKCAPTASGATATATATRASPPAPSCGVPATSAAALPAGMVWGMPMPVVRAPGIVPPKGAAAAARLAPAQAPAAPWGYMGCPPSGIVPPSYMMMPPCMPGMQPYGPPHMFPPGGFPFGPAACGPYACMPPPPLQQQHQHSHHPQQQQQPQAQPAPAHPTGAAAAQALEASLMTLLGSAEDDGDLDVDFDDVLQQLRAPDDACAASAAAGPSSDGAASGSASDCCDALAGGAAALCGASSAPESHPARGGDDFGAFLGGGGGKLCGGLGLEDWGDDLPALKKSGSLVDLLAEPMAIVA